MQKVKISRWGSPKIGYYTKLSHCKRNWDFSCKIVAPRNFFVFNGDFGGFQWGNFQNSEFAYYASKSGKCIKQTPTPPFWGDVGVKKWSQILDSVLCCITVRLTLLKVTPVGNCFCSGCCCLSWTGMPVRLLRMRRVYTAPAILLLAAIVVERPCNSKRLTIQ